MNNKELYNYFDHWNCATKATSSTIKLDLDNPRAFILDGVRFVIDTMETNTLENTTHINAHSIDGITYLQYGNKSYSDEPKNKLDAMKIKKVIANPKKDATTVIFKDGSVEVVKKSPYDNEADIYSVVAYAIAKHIYGSNSAFQKEVAKNIQFTKDKELNKLISKTSIGELNSALRNILNALKREE